MTVRGGGRELRRRARTSGGACRPAGMHAVFAGEPEPAVLPDRRRGRGRRSCRSAAARARGGRRLRRERRPRRARVIDGVAISLHGHGRGRDAVDCEEVDDARRRLVDRDDVLGRRRRERLHGREAREVAVGAVRREVRLRRAGEQLLLVDDPELAADRPARRLRRSSRRCRRRGRPSRRRRRAAAGRRSRAPGTSVTVQPRRRIGARSRPRAGCCSCRRRRWTRTSARSGRRR